MAKNPVTGSEKELSSKEWPAATSEKLDSALIGGVANGKPNTRTAPKQGNGMGSK